MPDKFELEYGENIKDSKGNLCINLICSQTGEKQSVTFGKTAKIKLSTFRKPVISFRFGKKAKIIVRVNFGNGKGKYKVIYPMTEIAPNNDLIWRGEVQENNQILIENNGKSKKYPYLFWDGVSDIVEDFGFESGFCVAKNDIINFLEEKCELFGFDYQLTTDFVTFWSSYLMENEFSLIRFLDKNECQKIASLDVECVEKLQIIRMYMMFTNVPKKVKIPKQKLKKINLEKICKIYDWGGFEKII